MKSRTYANRGMKLEKLIKVANKQYRRDGIAMVEKQNTKFLPIRNAYGKVINCKVEEKSTVDFIGRINARPVAFEAKNTNTDRISLSEVKSHQEEFLNEWDENEKSIAFVIVAFNQMEEFYAVPWKYWSTALALWNHTKGGKAVIEIYGKKVTTTGKASLKNTDMLPEWRIDTHGNYALDYVQALSETEKAVEHEKSIEELRMKYAK